MDAIVVKVRDGQVRNTPFFGSAEEFVHEQLLPTYVPHMPVVLDPHGPFFNCDNSGHREPERLESRKAPAG
jgi:hypothetical protein